MSERNPFKPAELKIIRLLADGQQAKNISFETGYTLHTVRVYTHRYRRIAGAATVPALVAKALREGWIK